MESNAFAALATLHLPSPSRILPSACCPDKDLVALISRLGGQDRLGLWKIQGSKTWEVDVSADDGSSTHIVGLSWSPDGQTIAVAHDPPCITLHSLQDGQRHLTLPITAASTFQRHATRLTEIWWFQEEMRPSTSIIPDIFRRNDVITGTAHSILKALPLLDNLQEDSQKLTATDLFAFQGSQTRSAIKPSAPEYIQGWPTLATDLTAASISSMRHGKTPHQDGGAIDEVDTSNMNSILAVADDTGHIHCFLDGSFPLGAVSLDSGKTVSSLIKQDGRPRFYVHPRKLVNNATITDLRPTVIDIPLLARRQARDLARLSSTARELVWYTIRVVKEMRAVWFGSESFSGARELGPKWVRALESKQKEQFGQEEPNPILDLTALLVTGRTSDSLLDYLGSGEQMSERGIQKWESTVTEALVKLRDFSEKRVAPACQRLHIVLEEIRGWSHLSQYVLFQLSAEELDICLNLTRRAIVIAGWLAAVARRELSRFREFISWLRFETTAANPSNDNNATPRHDILEVNNYFISGLVVSSIDKWFMGPVPQFSARDLGVPEESDPLIAVLERAQGVADDPGRTSWQATVPQKDLNHIDRNLDALVQDIAVRCHRIFDRAAGAASRSAVISSGSGLVTGQAVSARPSAQPINQFSIRERTTFMSEGYNWIQYLAVNMPSEQRSFLCLVRLRITNEVSELPIQAHVALLECCLPGEEEEILVHLDLLEVEFFDDECVVIVYRLRDQDKSTFIATVNYNDLGYQDLHPDGYVSIPPREDLMLDAKERWKQGMLPSVRSPITRCRALTGCKDGAVSLAVNGRVGRRVACVLDNKGTSMESFDLEGDGDDMEVESGDLEADADVPSP